MDSMWHSLLWQASLVTEGPSLGKGPRRVSEAQRKHPIFLTAKADFYKCANLMCCLFTLDIFKLYKSLRGIYRCATLSQRARYLLNRTDCQKAMRDMDKEVRL